MIRYHAAWVVPVCRPPVKDGWVSVGSDGRIAAIGQDGKQLTDPEPLRGEVRHVHLGNVALMPGLVNAHTHLELSYLHERVPGGPAFVDWIRGVMSARRGQPDPRAPEIVEAIARAIASAEAAGTAVVGDIGNTLVAFGPLVGSRLAAVLFYELIRFSAPDPVDFVGRARHELDALTPSSRVRTSLAAHAPYSVAPGVFRAIRELLDRGELARASVHLAESLEEVEFIASGTGSWRTLLEDVGAWNPDWRVPGVTPVEYLDSQGFLDRRVLAIHGVQMSSSDLLRLAASGATLVTCPRSNRHTGAGVPPIESFYRSGASVAIGTDSLASAPDLNLFAELATMRAMAPTVPASALLESATWRGAEALGFGQDYGTIEPGKNGHLLAVAVPAGTGDVEEYLVRGIEPGQLRWTDASNGERER